MESIKLKKSNILKIGIQTEEGVDTGEYLEFDLEDIELPIKIQQCIEEHKKNQQFIRNQFIIIDKRQDRKGKKLNLARPIVLNANRPYTPEKGFRNSHLALWASHGWYFEKSENRWIWQRPRLFQIAEDTYTLGYVLPYLVPMLENSGAYVFLPRERDFQSNEIIVDNDDPKGDFYKETNGEKLSWEDGDSVGFAHRKEVYSEGENPFNMGSYRQIISEKKLPKKYPISGISA